MSVWNSILENAIFRGLDYLENLFESKPWAFSATSCTKDRITFNEIPDYRLSRHPERFTHFTALDLLQKELSSFVRSTLLQSLTPSTPSTMNYFLDCRLFPDDVDTTALGYAVLLEAQLVNKDEVLPIAELVFGNVNTHEVVEVYIKPAEDRKKNLVDACSCANALRLGYMLGQESKLEKTEKYVFEWLKSGKWKQGTIYYHSGFPFLYFCSNFVKTNQKVQKKFRSILTSAIENSLEDCKLPLDYAMVLLALENLGIRDYSESISTVLLQMQEEDGSWPADAIWGNTHGVLFGGKAVSTIFIVGALVAARGC
ncbi:unnamed protein product [Allacma fusca]|uniref:Uncharacterized protein n=1 Tax=Allacma fusca TaxID=39272 RepID=A0A8J2JKG8_9HEXA|nr:unnamed protein product [Allacma fusca]CAG7723382.1 unnamed protein product [Allacma fusca]